MGAREDWAVAPRRCPGLETDEVHVWRFELDLDPTTSKELRALLSPDELHRAERFHFEIDRKRFAVGRGRMRDLLSRYAGVPPHRLRFALGPHGKPSLAGEQVGGLAFNLSHSGGLALLAVGKGCEVGVDVERLRDRTRIDEVSEHFFTRDERQGLMALAVAARRPAFFAVWTRKEAYIKGVGKGFALDARQVGVSVPPDPARLVCSPEGEGEPERWSMTDLEPGEGYAGALAIARDEKRSAGSTPALLRFGL